MIYEQPALDAAIDQGDLISACPILAVTAFDANLGKPTSVEFEPRRVLVLTQTRDLANE